MRGKFLARKANILSFDDAKAVSRSRVDGNGAARPRKARDGYTPLRMPSSRSARMAGERHFETWSGDDAEEQRTGEKHAQGAGHKSDARERRRRERTKARADRMFAKQFENDPSSPGQDEGAPRAALYEGKMGASHRRSARMQQASTALPHTAKINPAGWFSHVNISRKALRLGTALLCIVLVGVFLYTPAQQYYQAQRERDRLAAEYAVLAQRNDALGEQNDTLSSNAGMEDAVREKYGYVVKGDETAVVSGLSEPTTDSSRDGENIEANVLASAVKAPEEWYTPYLDAFFGVS